MAWYLESNAIVAPEKPIDLSPVAKQDTSTTKSTSKRLCEPCSDRTKVASVTEKAYYSQRKVRKRKRIEQNETLSVETVRCTKCIGSSECLLTILLRLQIAHQ